MSVCGSHTTHFTAAWPVLHFLFQVQKKSDQINSAKFSSCRGLNWWQAPGSRCAEFSGLVKAEETFGEATNRTGSGKVRSWQLTPLQKIKYQQHLLCTHGTRERDPVALSWGLLVWAVKYRELLAQIGISPSKAHRKKEKREGRINHCCCGERLPERSCSLVCGARSGDKRLIESDECNWVVWKRGDEMKWKWNETRNEEEWQVGGRNYIFSWAIF